MTPQWQAYKELELLPVSAVQPKDNWLVSRLLLSPLWRSLLNALAQEHFHEQRREYFERCWAIDYADPYTTRHIDQLKKLLTLMD